MNIFLLEKMKVKLLSELSKEKTPLDQLIILNIFFEEVKKTEDTNIFEIYSAEFISHYINTIRNLNIIGLNPKLWKPVISRTKDLLDIIAISSKEQDNKNIFNRIDDDARLIKKSLIGIKEDQEIGSLSFPAIIKSNNSNYFYGQIEKFSVKIHNDTSLKKNKFLIIPTSAAIENRFEEQINISWEIAITYLKKHYKTPNKFHEVVLIFNNRYANIEGYSLGVSITLGFIQELFKFYNTPLKLTLCKSITFTGGFDSNELIKSIGNEIIIKKVETVFFSQYNYFALPDSDLIAAKKHLNMLLKEYPKRELKIISLKDFEDLFSHRQIIDIQKSKFLERGAKYVRNNIPLVFILIALLISAGLITIYTTDNNPNGFQNIGKNVNVVNKHGKILWTIKGQLDYSERTRYESYLQRIVDINDDGTNEILLANELLEKKDVENQGRIACFNNENKLLWKYKFRDSITTEKEVFKDQYLAKIIDITIYDNKKIVVAMARHLYFPSAIFFLDALTGERIEGTLWSQGHFNTAKVGDFNGDGEIELFAGGINNGLESAFALIKDLKNLSGQTPSIESYLFKNIQIATFRKFFLFPKTDLCNLYENRFNRTDGVHYYEENNTYQIGVDEKYPNKILGPQFVINNELDSVWIQIGDAFQFIRDSLVTKGLLKKPFTNDIEYSNILINGIQEWNGSKFVKFNSNK